MVDTSLANLAELRNSANRSQPDELRSSRICATNFVQVAEGWEVSMRGLILFAPGIFGTMLVGFAAQAGPLQDAAKSGNQAGILKALKSGAKINGRDDEGKTALYRAVAGNHLKIARLLIKRNANPNVLNRGIQGEIDAPIHIATRNGNLAAIRLLAAVKASLTLSTYYADAPYAMALKYKQEKAAKLLKQLGAANYSAPSVRHLIAKADVNMGRLLTKSCLKCHALKTGGRPTGGYGKPYGPPLWNVVGRKKAGLAGEKYSAALRASKGKWTFDEINSFIANPSAYLPGTRKWYLVNKQRLRAAIIAYLRTLSDRPVPVP